MSEKMAWSSISWYSMDEKSCCQNFETCLFAYLCPSVSHIISKYPKNSKLSEILKIIQNVQKIRILIN